MHYIALYFAYLHCFRRFRFVCHGFPFLSDGRVPPHGHANKMADSSLPTPPLPSLPTLPSYAGPTTACERSADFAPGGRPSPFSLQRTSYDIEQLAWFFVWPPRGVWRGVGTSAARASCPYNEYRYSEPLVNEDRGAAWWCLLALVTSLAGDVVD